MIDPQAEEWAVELQLPTREIGPREEPERYATRFIVNDGQWTPEEHEEQLYKASQAWNCKQWNREAREAAERHNAEFNRSMEEWKAQVERRGLKDHPAIHLVHLRRRLHPCELFQMSTKLSGRMILPRLQGRNQSSRKPLQQQVEATGRGRPAGFYSADEPPRIATAPVQPPPPPKPMSPLDVQPPGLFQPPAPLP